MLVSAVYVCACRLSLSVIVFCGGGEGGKEGVSVFVNEKCDYVRG